MQFSMCSCFCHTSNVCVYRISIFAKNSRKTLQKSRFARFCKLFSRIFCKYFDPIHTHIFSVAKAFTQTKLHSSENKVPSSILHLIVESIIDVLRVPFQDLSFLYHAQTSSITPLIQTKNMTSFPL